MKNAYQPCGIHLSNFLLKYIMLIAVNPKVFLYTTHRIVPIFLNNSASFSPLKYNFLFKIKESTRTRYFNFKKTWYISNLQITLRVDSVMSVFCCMFFSILSPGDLIEKFLSPFVVFLL